MPRLLAVGSLTAVKDQSTLVAALGQVADVPWTASFLGGDTVDPGYAATVRDAIQDAGLCDRIAVGGAVGGDALETEWAAADLLIHPSRSETYGLVVTEALARGIPAVVTAGTGLVEALHAGRRPGDRLAGATIPPGDPEIQRHPQGAFFAAERDRARIGQTRITRTAPRSPCR